MRHTALQADLDLDYPPLEVVPRKRPRRSWPRSVPSLPSFLSYRRRRTRCLKLWQLLQWRLEKQIAEPVTISVIGPRHRVCAMGCVTYVFDHDQRKIWVEALQPDGTILDVVEAFNFLRPLASRTWIKSWLALQQPLIERVLQPCDAGEQQECLRWLDTCVGAFVRRQRALPRIRATLSAALRQDAALCSQALRLPPMRGRAPLNALHVEDVWCAIEPIERIAAMNAELLPLWWVARQTNRIGPEDGLAQLKRVTCGLGVSAAAWRLLCRRGRRVMAALRGSFYPDFLVDAAGRLAQVLSHAAAWPHRAMLKALSKSEMICAGNTHHIPPGLLSAAFDEAAKQSALGRFAYWYETEFECVADWTRRESPTFDANQRRMAWAGWLRAYRRITAAQESEQRARHWTGEVEHFTWGEFLAIHLSSGEMLHAEGLAMGHCIFDYSERCYQGDIRAYSIRQRSDGRRIATCTLVMNSTGYWELDDVKAPCNRWPEEAVADFARRLAMFYDDLVHECQ